MSTTTFEDSYMETERETLLVNAPNEFRPSYEEAIKRYKGSAQIEIWNEAYCEPGQIWPGYFSVHAMNNQYDLSAFWKIFYQVRVEHGQPGDPLRRA